MEFNFLLSGYVEQSCWPQGTVNLIYEEYFSFISGSFLYSADIS